MLIFWPYCYAFLNRDRICDLHVGVSIRGRDLAGRVRAGWRFGGRSCLLVVAGAVSGGRNNSRAGDSAAEDSGSYNIIQISVEQRIAPERRNARLEPRRKNLFKANVRCRF